METTRIFNDYGMDMGYVIHDKKTDTYTMFSCGKVKTYKTMMGLIEHLDALDWFINQHAWVDKSYLVE